MDAITYFQELQKQSLEFKKVKKGKRKYIMSIGFNYFEFHEINQILYRQFKLIK